MNKEGEGGALGAGKWEVRLPETWVFKGNLSALRGLEGLGLPNSPGKPFHGI